MARAKGLILRWLQGKSFAGDNELYQYYFLTAVFAYATAVYLGFVLLYTWEGLWPLSAICLAGAIIMLCGMLMVRRRQLYLAAGLLFSLFTLATTVAGIFSFGNEGSFLFYFILLFILQCTTPYAKPATRALLALASVGAILFATRAPRWLTPYYTLKSPEALVLYNTLAGLVGVGLQLLLVSSTRDVTAEYHTRRLNALCARSHSDPITGLYDSRHAWEFFDNLRLGRSCESWCVAMLGIDDICENGQTAAVVTAQVASAIRSGLRYSDVVVHWGQGRFLLILQGAALPDSVHLLDHLRTTIAALPIEAAGQTLHTTVTIGVTRLDLDDVQGCLEICSEKMNIGKQLGQDRVVA